MSETKPKILFIDDEQHILDGIKRKLHRELKIWEVSFFNDPIQAKKAILNEAYDVVISDVRMPGIDGISLLKDIKQAAGFNNPEFIILTGEGDADLKRRALDLDAADLLNKPVQKEELLARINNALRLKKAKDEILEKNKLLEAQLFQSQKMETIGMMAAGAAHDFNNVLAAIITSLELAEIKYGANSAVIQDVRKIQKVAQHGKQITAQILKFVKKKKIKYELVHLNHLIDEVIDVVRISIAKMVEIKWTDSEKDIIVQADYTQVFQMVLNLCLNASKAMQGSGTISLSLSQKEMNESYYFLGKEVEAGVYACITVSDNGPGMDEKLIRNLQDNPVSIKPSKSGTGLGLSIVARTLINHSGFFVIESAKTTGTEFNLYLPIPMEGSG